MVVSRTLEMILRVRDAGATATLKKNNDALKTTEQTMKRMGTTARSVSEGINQSAISQLRQRSLINNSFIKSLVNSRKIENATKKVVPAVQRIGDAQRILNQVIAKQNLLRRRNNIILANTATVMKDKVLRAARMNRGVMLGFGLSVMFAGMAMQRFGVGGLRALVNTSKIAGAETTVFSKKTEQLTASWEFVKFSIISALSQSPLFLNAINFIINLVNGVGEWIAANKEAALAIVGTFAIFAVGGALMAVVGQFVTFYTGVKGLGMLIKGTETIMGTAAAPKSVVGKFAGGLGLMRGLIGGGLIIGAGFKLFGKPAGEVYSALELFEIIGLATAGGFVLGGPLGAFASATIVMTIVAIRSGAIQRDIERVKNIIGGTGIVSRAAEEFGKFREAVDIVKAAKDKLPKDETAQLSELLAEIANNTSKSADLLDELRAAGFIPADEINRTPAGDFS